LVSEPINPTPRFTPEILIDGIKNGGRRSGRIGCLHLCEFALTKPVKDPVVAFSSPGGEVESDNR